MGSPHLYIKGIVPADDQYFKMKTAYEACEAAGLDIPSEIQAFFGYETPEAEGQVIDLELHESLSNYDAEEREGFDVDLSKLPPHLKVLRFYIRW